MARSPQLPLVLMGWTFNIGANLTIGTTITHFTDWTRKYMQSVLVTYLKSHSQEEARFGFEHRSSESRLLTTWLPGNTGSCPQKLWVKALDTGQLDGFGLAAPRPEGPLSQQQPLDACPLS